MENIQNQTINEDNNKEGKKIVKNKKILFPSIIFLLAIVFISSTLGAVFGFLASKTDLESIPFFDKSKQVRKEINEKANTIKQEIIQEDSAVINVVKNSVPSVVSIVISKDIPKIRTFRGIPNFFDDPFGFNFDFNQDQFYDNNEKKEKQTVGGGTGFFVSNDGMIVTNRHVVDDKSADYTVVTDDDKEHPAKVLAVDPVNDIAIIKIEGDNYQTLSMGDSNLIQIGQTAIAIGNSLGEFSNTVSRGIISGLKRNLTAGNGMGKAERLNNIIQTDAAINPGNSGGPLLDINGQVIGINVAIAQGAQNIGFAIPSNQVKKIIEQVKKDGKISTPFIGLRYIPIDEELQKENDLPYDYGCLVARGEKITDLAVIPGSPADKAGIVENDIILEVNGEKITDKNDLSSLIAQYNVGDSVSLKIWHKGKEKDLSITLSERK